VTVAIATLALLLGGGHSLPRASRCQLLHAILGVPHSRARAAFRDLECVQKVIDRKRFLVRGTITGDEGTHPLLEPGERCAEGYLGADVARLSRSRRPQSFVELRLAWRGPDEMSFSALLETWGGASRGVACGASGEGTVRRDAQGWKVQP
jgi:hypothetical protein